MKNRSKKIRNRNFSRKSIKRNRKSNKNNRLKKLARGKPTIRQPQHIFITYYGEDFYQPDGMADGGMTIKDLIDSKRDIFNLYHRGRLLSRYYPSNALVFKALRWDGEPGHYNIQVTRIIEGEEPPEKIDIAEVNPNVDMPDPYDDGYW